MENLVPDVCRTGSNSILGSIQFFGYLETNNINNFVTAVIAFSDVRIPTSKFFKAPVVYAKISL
jgi:hypothetical protein